jgi:hypothetical protein
MSASASYEVFISYSREDEEAAFLLRAALDEYETTYYLDQTSNKVGDAWLKNIKSAIDCARYFALIYSENANKSTYVKQEVEYAAGVPRRGWIMLDGSPRPEAVEKLLGPIHASEAYKGDWDSAIRSFAKSITVALWKPVVLQLGQVHVSRENCPYRPYLPYKESDKLFGRGQEIVELTKSIYQAIKKDTVRNLNRRRLVFVYGPSGTGKSSLMASGVIPRLKMKTHAVGPLRLHEMEKTLEEYAAESNGEPCVIAIDQFEEAWAESDHRIPSGPRLVHEIIAALGNPKFKDNLAIALGFRDEYLAKFERDFEEIEKIRHKHPVPLLDPVDAEDCIRGPAAELGIAYEDKLAAALVKALSKPTKYSPPGEEDRPYVEPVELQIVCEALWNSVNRRITEMHSSHLLHACREMKLKVEHLNADHVEELARIFFEHVTTGFLDGAVADIRNTQAAINSKYNTPERIYFALRQFVSDTRKRTSIETHDEGGQKWVGRLPMTIVQEMTIRRLLKDAPGEERFELVHDRLAEKIIEKKEQMELFYAVNSLDSEMTKVKQKRTEGFSGWFDDRESTVKDMNEFKNFQGLDQEEAQFIFRSALAYSKDKQKELEDWAWTVADQHSLILAEVLHDAFSKEQQNGRVRMNAAILLRKKWLQAKLLRTGEFTRILAKLQEASGRASERVKKYPNLDSELADLQTTYERKIEDAETNQHVPAAFARLQADYERAIEYARKNPDADSELEELCYTLATCPVYSNCEHLGQVLPRKGDLTRVDTRVLLWMRDKADMDTGDCFAKGWKALATGRRAWLTLQLYWLRLRQAFLRMAFVVFVSTMATAVGAALMFAFWGSFGASFTQASSVSGVGQGLFHGVFGGIIWGSFTSLATLIYWLILRGRRIEKKFSHWLGGVALSALSGLLGGIVLSIMVLNVDAVSTMKAAGWLKLNEPLYRDAFRDAGGGWILPIYGLFLGIGVGWSMLSLYHDRNFRTFVSQQKPLKSGNQFLKWLREILLRTLRRSGPTATGMALAAVLVCFLFRGHTLDCKPFQWDRPARCKVQEMYPAPEPREKQDGQRIARLELRAAGMAAIIFAGAYSMTVGYLLLLLTIRFGVEVPEDNRFLGTDELHLASKQSGVAAATETP